MEIILNFLNPYKKGARMIFYTNIHLKKPYEEQAIIQKIKNNKIYLNIYKKDFLEVVRKEIISRNPKYSLCTDLDYLMMNFNKII